MYRPTLLSLAYQLGGRSAGRVQNIFETSVFFDKIFKKIQEVHSYIRTMYIHSNIYILGPSLTFFDSGQERKP
jgi:hypothetical protein